MSHLASELEEIRSKGVAVDSNGLGEGVISVAVAVRDYAGKVGLRHHPDRPFLPDACRSA